METAAEILAERYTGNSLHVPALRSSVMDAAKESKNGKLPFDNELIGIFQKVSLAGYGGRKQLGLLTLSNSLNSKIQY